ncbi:MAG: hypothetical protein ACTSQ9_06860 [Candidatus Hodarchaeales archaeon]
MDPIGHLEWTLGIGLALCALLQIPLDALSFLLLGIGSDFPDLFDWALYHGKNESDLISLIYLTGLYTMEKTFKQAIEKFLTRFSS